jgi:hypothetical protein
MATNLDIIKRAMKKLHVLPSGKEPTAAQAFDGMANLQSLIVELIGQGSLGRLNDVLATADYEVYEFDRVRADPGVTVTIPDTITKVRCDEFDDAWNFGSVWPAGTISRAPLDRAVVVVFDGDTDTVIYSVYSAYKGAWVVINSLTEQGDFPFADYLDDGFAALLAERWAPEWDQPVTPDLNRQANACRVMLGQRRDSQPRNTSSHSQYM